MEDLESKCYDKFDFRLEDLQILIVKAGKHELNDLHSDVFFLPFEFF